jgi:hypothetical protein
MFTAQLQAMGGGHVQTSLMAIPAHIDAILHGSIHR